MRTPSSTGHWTTPSQSILRCLQVCYCVIKYSIEVPLILMSHFRLPVAPQNSIASEYSWDVVDEYDPMWPNEYDKLVKEKRDRNKEREEKRRESSSSSSSSLSSNTKRHRKSDDSPKYSGFAGRPSSDDEDSGVTK